jgi:hypothetical protein
MKQVCAANSTPGQNVNDANATMKPDESPIVIAEFPRRGKIA